MLCPFCSYILPQDLRSPQGQLDVRTKNQQYLPLTPLQSTLRYSEFLAQTAPNSPGSILPKADQSTDVCRTLVSRNGQGKAIYKNCGLRQAGVSTQTSTRIFMVLYVEKREAAHWEADAQICSGPRPTSIRSSLQLRSTSDYNIKRERGKKGMQWISPMACPFLPLGRVSTRFFPLLQEQIQKQSC